MSVSGSLTFSQIANLNDQCDTLTKQYAEMATEEIIRIMAIFFDMSLQGRMTDDRVLSYRYANMELARRNQKIQEEDNKAYAESQE